MSTDNIFNYQHYHLETYCCLLNNRFDKIKAILDQMQPDLVRGLRRWYSEVNCDTRLFLKK